MTAPRTGVDSPSHDGPCELAGCPGDCPGGPEDDACGLCGREFPCECPDPCNMCGALDCYGECDRNEDGG